MMKQKIDRLAGAIVLGFHIYCDVILGAVLAVVGAAGFYHSFFIKVNEDRAESPGTPQFQGFPHNLKTWVSLCFPFYPERLLM